MTIVQGLLLALIEGLTEFLPVSSTAHLLLFDHYFPASNRNFFAVFSVVIQLGAMLAILNVFWRQLWQAKQIWGRLIVAIIPTIIIGLLAKDWVEQYLQDASALTGWVLIGGGLVFTLLDYLWRGRAKTPPTDYCQQVAHTSFSRLALVGVAQAVALIPGVSRAGATIFGARALGFSQLAAANLSFVLGLPVIAGASALMLVSQVQALNIQVVCDCVALPCVCPPVYSVFNHPSDLGLLLLGTALAFLVAFLTAKLLLKILGTKPFFYFGLYRLLVGLIWLLSF